MKFLVLLLVFLFAVWLFRSRQQARTRPRDKQPPQGKQPIEACAHCGVHAVKADMLVGQHGSYCSIEHLQRAGDKVVRG
jgi:uncharacterized protein